jgi:hypothetical protein
MSGGGEESFFDFIKRVSKEETKKLTEEEETSLSLLCKAQHLVNHHHNETEIAKLVAMLAQLRVQLQMHWPSSFEEKNKNKQLVYLTRFSDLAFTIAAAEQKSAKRVLAHFSSVEKDLRTVDKDIADHCATSIPFKVFKMIVKERVFELALRKQQQPK